ncbi:MAG: hypothetical protein R3F62_26180 [Planctomycetota bacterium]
MSSGRLDMAQRFFEAARMELVSGSAAPRGSTSGRSASSTRSAEVHDQAAACGAHLERMKSLHSAVSDRARAPASSRARSSTALCYVIEAELWLRSARGEDPTEIAHQLTQASREAYRELEERFKSTARGSRRPAWPRCACCRRTWTWARSASARRISSTDRVHALEQRARRWAREGHTPELEAQVGAFFRWEAEFLFSLLNTQRRTRSKAFADRRLGAAREIYGALQSAYEAGRGQADALALWSLRWMRAARDANEESGGDPLARETLDEHLERLLQHQTHLRTTQPIGVALDLGALEYFVLEAQCWIQAA